VRLKKHSAKSVDNVPFRDQPKKRRGERGESKKRCPEKAMGRKRGGRSHKKRRTKQRRKKSHAQRDISKTN